MRREERVVVKAILRPPFPFFDIGERGGYAHGLERESHTARDAQRTGAALSAVSVGGPRRGGSDGRIATALGPAFAGGGLRARGKLN